MPEHLRALVVLLAMFATVVSVWRPSDVAIGSSASLVQKRVFVWLLLTLMAFLIGNFWGYVVLGLLVMLVAGRKDTNPLALYVLLLFAVPSFEKEIPGFGAIDHLFRIHHYRMLNLSILLPLLLSLPKRTASVQRASRVADWALVVFFVLIVAAHLRDDTLTSTIRTMFYFVVDIGLPYLAASRAIVSQDQARDVLSMLFFIALFCALVAIFENIRYWLLYESLRTPFQVPGDAWVYLTRGEDRLLRAKASVQNSIALGYVLMIALAMVPLMLENGLSRAKAALACVLLIGGLAATVSRGPWVGAAAAVLVIMILGPGMFTRAVKSAVIASLVGLIVLVSPLGDRIVPFLPFVGTIESGNITYRATLFDVSMAVLRDHWLLGDIHFLQDPRMQALRQGQGIIDIVNSYLQIALPYGISGLACFVILMFLAMRSANALRKRLDPQSELLGRVLLAALVGIAVTIATVSSISIIPVLYWPLLGLAVACTRFSGAPRGTAANRRQPDDSRREGEPSPRLRYRH